MPEQAVNELYGEEDHIIKVLSKVKKALKQKNIVELKNLSNMTVHSASIHQQEDFIALAVIIYGIAKIVERTKYREYEQWPEFHESVISYLNKAIKALKQKNIQQFRKHLISIRQQIQMLTGKFGEYIREVFRKAMINKASRIYEHGISMENTARLLGITLFELAEYAGKTGISDVDLSITKSLNERLSTAKRIFGIE